MCLSTVYEVSGNGERLVCEHTTNIELDGPTIRLTDIVGEEIIIDGVLKSIDLVKNIIKIEAR